MVADAIKALSEAFEESKHKDFSDPIDENELFDDYGYYSDSDLEEGHERQTRRPLQSW